MRIFPILIATGHYYKRDHIHKINHMIKFTLHSFTVSHVIDDVMDLRDVISTSAVHGLYNRVNPLSPIPVSSITQQQKKIIKKNNQISMYNT